MSKLHIVGGDNEEEKLNYNATQEDEEKFLLMYHMNMAPSEVDKLDPDRRKWIITRFVAQKNMERDMIMQEREAMMQQHLAQQLAQKGDLRVK